MFEIKLDSIRFNSNRADPWLSMAARSLSEAMGLSAGLVLDAEPNDLKNGYRILSGNGRDVVEIFLYDNLSSGAGYSSELASKVDELMAATRKLLEGCDCDSACFRCLKNYGNKMFHDSLDRFAALDLLNWAVKGEVPSALTSEQQAAILNLLKNLRDIDISKVFVYPSAWGIGQDYSSDKVSVFRFRIEKQLPLAYSDIAEMLR